MLRLLQVPDGHLGVAEIEQKCAQQVVRVGIGAIQFQGALVGALRILEHSKLVVQVSGCDPNPRMHAVGRGVLE